MQKLKLEHDPDVFLKKALITDETFIRDIPRDWIVYIEPHVNRESFPPHWWWEGRVDERRDRTHPTMRNPYHKRGSYCLVRRFIAGMYFAYPETHHVHMTCTFKRCINPSHYVIKALDPRQFDIDDYE